MQKPLIFDFLFSCKSKTHYHVKGALSESESFSNSEMAYWKSDGYTNFGKVVVVAVVVGGGGGGM